MSETPSEAAAAMTLASETGDAALQRFLTIVVPAYRHEAYVEQCLRSIDGAGQADRIELILIDDGSPDQTLEKAIKYPFGSALRVRVFTKPNSGLIDSLSKGLALVTTPYVAFIASDDYYCTPELDRLVRELATYRGGDICWVCQASYLQGRDGQPVYGPAMVRNLDLPPKDRLKALSIEHPKPLLLQSTAFSTGLLRSVGAWCGSEELDDWPTFIRIADWATAYPIDFRFRPGSPLMRYREHENGAHKDTSRQLRICLEVAENVVRPEYRREATSSVYADVSLVHFYQRQFVPAARLYWRALCALPSPRTALRGPMRVAAAVWRRFIGRPDAASEHHP